MNLGRTLIDLFVWKDISSSKSYSQTDKQTNKFKRRSRLKICSSRFHIRRFVRLQTATNFYRNSGKTGLPFQKFRSLGNFLLELIKTKCGGLKWPSKVSPLFCSSTLNSCRSTFTSIGRWAVIQMDRRVDGQLFVEEEALLTALIRHRNKVFHLPPNRNFWYG